MCVCLDACKELTVNSMFGWHSCSTFPFPTGRFRFIQKEQQFIFRRSETFFGVSAIQPAIYAWIFVLSINFDFGEFRAKESLTNLDVFSNFYRRKSSIYHYPLHEYDGFRLHSESVHDSIHTDPGKWLLMWTAYSVSPSNSIDASAVTHVSAKCKIDTS